MIFGMKFSKEFKIGFATGMIVFGLLAAALIVAFFL